MARRGRPSKNSIAVKIEEPDTEKSPFLLSDRIVIPVTPQLKRIAQDKALHQGRSLTVIVRAWIMGWVSGDFPDPDNLSDAIAFGQAHKDEPSK